MRAKKTIILLLTALLLLPAGCVKPSSLHVCDFKDENTANYPENLKTYITYRRTEYIEMEEIGDDVWAPAVTRIIPETNSHIVIKRLLFLLRLLNASSR